MNNYQIEHFTGKALVGAKVYYYPNGRKDVNTIPRVGFIQVGHTRGVCDIGVLPSQDGAVERIDHVHHIGDVKIFDHQGNLSRLAMNTGCWEYHPDELALREIAEHKDALLELVQDIKAVDQKTKKNTTKANA
jgi:hypothetical protein